MGPLLAKEGEVRVSLPGGCAIGNRPIDLHLKGFNALGADITLCAGDVVATASELRGCHIYLDYPSVGATENLMMAAALANGTSYIENAALEPEVVDLANFINAMGGRVYGTGTNVIRVEGVPKLHGVEYTPIPDRIEAGTYMVAVAATGGEAIVKNVPKGFIFDSHFVISELIKSHSDQYLTFSSKYAESSKVTLSTHGQIGKEINKLNGDLIELIGPSWSENIHRNSSECTCWKKL
jgi:UDP-N-acetylglucosamine enolpyruvyl transferase